MKKVVIFHISDFGGHSKAAQNIKEALSYRDSQLDILSMNGFSYFFPVWEKVIDFSYTKVIKHIPSFWGRIYDRQKVLKKLSNVRASINENAFKKLNALIDDFHPDCFVSTQAFPCGVVADFKKKTGLKLPLIAVVTDYHPHRFWVHPFVDKYIVACEEAKDTLIGLGIKEERIKILGIPISVQFLNSYPKEETAKEFGFNADLTSVLIMGGGLGIGPIEKITRKLNKLKRNFQIIAICGKNKKLYRWFRRNQKKFTKPTFYFGYIDTVNKIMDYSDIIITKGGGVTLSEALAKSLAIVITNPIPGQEEKNVEYLLKHDAVARVDRPGDVSITIKDLIEDKKRCTG